MSTNNEEQDAYELTQLMQEYSDLFDKLSYERHQEGAEAYGPFTFLENDVVRMMAEELADTSNYCRMQFIKLMMLNNLLVDHLKETGFVPEQKNDIKIGVKAFKGVKDTGWGKHGG